ncbi:hypothetical protein [Flaviflexus huanghaiensis]|uniref:hypothetical protein n=1 Tax=Flaviflexus huanghaiensis TaxID=1111473 RepID=UPI0015FA9262|nr:hypothetical protein [Flaviflexus huanghaiensis]
MENIRRLYWGGAVLGAMYSLSGIVVSILTGFPPGLLIAVTFSVIGAVIAYVGARKADLAWWAAGILMTGFVTPTTWGIVPLIIALALVLVAAVLVWQQERRRSRD